MGRNQTDVLVSVGWLVLSKGLTIPVNLFNLIVLARLLSPEDYGLVSLLVMTASFSAIFTDHGVVVPLIRATDVRQSDLTIAWMNAGLIGTVAGLAVVAAAPLLERHWSAQGMVGPLQVGALSIFAHSLAAPGAALLQRQGRFKLVAAGTTASYCLGYTPVALILALAGLGIWAVAFAYLAQAVLELGWALYQTGIPKPVRPSAVGWRERVRAGVLPTVSGLASWVGLNASNMAVAAHLGLVQLGYFNRANTMYTIALDVAATPTSQVVLRAFSVLQTDRDRFARAVTKVLGICLPLFSVGAAVVALHAGFFVHVILGAKWENSSYPLAILFIAFPGRSGYKILDAAAAASGQFGDAIYRQLAYAGGVVVLVTAGAAYGLVGVAAGIAIAVWMYFFASVWALRKSNIRASAVFAALRTSALLVLIYSCVDRLIFAVGDDYASLKHLFSIAGALAVTGLLLWFGPPSLVGQALWEFRTEARRWLRDYFERTR